MDYPLRLFALAGTLLFMSSAATATEVLRYTGSPSLQKEFVLPALAKFHHQSHLQLELKRSRSRDAALKDLQAGMVDLVGIDRFLTQQEKACGFAEYLLGWDPLVVAVHNTNSVNDISSENLRLMLSGKIRNWNEVGGRDLPILQVAAREDSEVHISVEAALLAEKHLSPQLIYAQVDADADRNVARLPAAFTVTSLSMVDVTGVKVLSVDGIPPDRQRVVSGEYPLRKPLLLISKGRTSNLLGRFLDFAKSPEGQTLISSKFYSVNEE